MTKNYWNKKGKYQKEADAVKDLVPATGMADTLTGEAVRLIQNAYYDFYNNGGCNERLEDLKFVYDWLDKHEVEHDEMGTIDYSKLYREFQNDTAYVLRITEKLERLADAVYSTAYKLETN